MSTYPTVAFFMAAMDSVSVIPEAGLLQADLHTNGSCDQHLHLSIPRLENTKDASDTGTTLILAINASGDAVWMCPTILSFDCKTLATG